MADVERLITLLNNPDNEVRVRAIIALGQVRDSHAAEPLIAILRQESDWEVCKHAVKAVGGTGDLRAIKPLIAMLRNPNMANTPRQIIVRAIANVVFLAPAAWPILVAIIGMILGWIGGATANGLWGIEPILKFVPDLLHPAR